MQNIKPIDDRIGNTPLVKTRRLGADLPAHIAYKLESFNPMSSVKDRIAKAMLDAAEAAGALTHETTIIEPTSGNTGIGLAFICAARGIPLILTMPESMSMERHRILRALGAKLELTEASKGMNGAIARAQELADTIDYSLILGQFDNPANPQAHYETTGPEIWHDTEGQVDVIVAGVGTGGTLSGSARYLKEQKPGVKAIAVEPEDSPVISGGEPGPHKIQGIGAGFIPENLEMQLVDGVVTVSNDNAMTFARKMAREEGVMVGISSGAVVWACIELAKKPEYKGKTIVGVLASHGERYLTTPLFNQDDA